MSNQYGPRIITDGLVLYLDAGNNKSYPGSGTTWYDLSGNNNYGTLVNSPTFSLSNKGSINLNGVTQYINITETSGMKPSVLTAEMIVKINSTTNTTFGGAPNTIQYLMFRQNTRTSNYEGYAVSYNEATSSFTISSTPSSGTPQYTVSSSTNTGLINNIYMISSIFDTSSMSLYINGLLQNSGAKATNIDYNNTHTLKIGRTVPVGATFDASAAASIYMIKIYNRALKSNEILQNYYAIKGRFNL